MCKCFDNTSCTYTWSHDHVSAVGSFSVPGPAQPLFLLLGSFLSTFTSFCFLSCLCVCGVCVFLYHSAAHTHTHCDTHTQRHTHTHIIMCFLCKVLRFFSLFNAEKVWPRVRSFCFLYLFTSDLFYIVEITRILKLVKNWIFGKDPIDIISVEWYVVYRTAMKKSCWKWLSRTCVWATCSPWGWAPL